MRPLRPQFSSLSLLLVLVSSAGTLHAQDLTVTGRVISARDSVPRGGASVQIKGANRGVLTTTAGNYSINLQSPSDTLVFTFLGFEPQEHPVDGSSVLVDGQTVLNVALEPSILAQSPSIRVTPFLAQPGAQGRNPNCDRTYAPMPGSAYDPNWQSNNPGMARAYGEGCPLRGGTIPRPRTIPRNNGEEPGIEF